MIVSVSGYVANAQGETLLVRTYWRGDTWELPGGQVDDGETLHDALRREVWEETGLEVRPLGVTGVYHNATRNILCVVFRAQPTGGTLRTSPETQEVAYVPLTPENVGEYLTRPHFRQRVVDALRGSPVPYEAYQVDPFISLLRLEPDSTPP
jgi:8-oxo-dGTP diphosphatase